METSSFPENLVECVRFYSDPENCFNFAVSMRWPEGITCPYCNSRNHTFMSSRKMWQCNDCRKQFSVKVGTIFEESRLSLDKWFIAAWLIGNSKNGISSHEIARHLGVTQKTAWFLLHRIRYAMQTGSFLKATGTTEVDETFVGGKAKNMHYDKKKEKIQGRGASGKTVVLGLLERGIKADKERGIEGSISKVRTAVVPDTKEETLVPIIEANVEKGTEVFTDAHKAYRVLGEKGFQHAFVDHAIRYVEGRVYTNGMENYWGLLDRMMHGTYVHCDPAHLFRYTDELSYRFNHRDGTDLTRFLQIMTQTEGKRLTYRKLTQGHLKHLAPE